MVWFGSLVRPHVNWVVLSPGSWIIDMRTFDLRCRSSVMTLSVNPLQACLAPQYGDWSGMPRYDIAEHTWTIDPLSRSSLRLSAERVPQTMPRYVTSVARRNWSGSMSRNSAYTVTIASLTQMSIGPKASSTDAAAASTWSASATSTGSASAWPPSCST